jgi:hypothetical protein
MHNAGGQTRRCVCFGAQTSNMGQIAADIFGVTQLLNRIVVTGILVTAFALIISIGIYNRMHPIPRGFAIMLACVIGAFLGDLLTQVSLSDTDQWLRWQWIGIAFMPAGALSLSDDLLQATGDTQPLRTFAARAGFIAGAVIFGLVMSTDWVASPGLDATRLPHLAPGLLFYPFSLFYFACLGWATYNVIEARRRSLTATNKRRMTYFALAFAFPGLGMFPYLLPVGWPALIPLIVPWFVVLLVNMAVGAAITFMGYTVSYYGASAPDRVIKRRMVKYLIRGPLLAALVITALVLSSRVERWLDLPGFFLGLIAAATIILTTQLLIVTLQPTIDRLIAGEDSFEVRRLQQFSERLMTSSDQTQYLENILAAACDLLRARSAFIAAAPPNDGSTRIEPMNITIGSVEPRAGDGQMSLEALRAVLVHEQTEQADESADAVDGFAPGRKFIQWQDYWLTPLRATDTIEVLGVMGLTARANHDDLNDDEKRGVALLFEQAERALEDSLKQRRAFEALERLVPEAEAMQRRLAQTARPGAPTLSDFENPAAENYDDMTRYVQDALKDFWGGPKFTDSPLMQLQIVADAMKVENGNATKALRRVLSDAIDRLKPESQRSFTAAEWMLYNILELKILQGQKVRDVAVKLFMSESDLYRKQKAAFAEVARVVAEMEREARNRVPG